MTPIYRELHRWSALPFTRGETDCATCIADWLMVCGWPDPMADVRGLYEDDLTCERATGFVRDPMGSVSRRLAAIGLPRGNELRAGDVALIRVRGIRLPVGALWTGQAWAAKGPDGTTTIRPELVDVLGFWSVGYSA